MKQTAWDVIGRFRFEGGRFYPTPRKRLIDIVFFDADIETAQVWKSLVEHDGYPPEVEVRRSL